MTARILLISVLGITWPPGTSCAEEPRIPAHLKPSLPLLAEGEFTRAATAQIRYLNGRPPETLPDGVDPLKTALSFRWILYWALAGEFEQAFGFIDGLNFEDRNDDIGARTRLMQAQVRSLAALSPADLDRMRTAVSRTSRAELSYWNSEYAAAARLARQSHRGIEQIPGDNREFLIDSLTVVGLAELRLDHIAASAQAFAQCLEVSNSALEWPRTATGHVAFHAARAITAQCDLLSVQLGFEEELRFRGHSTALIESIHGTEHWQAATARAYERAAARLVDLTTSERERFATARSVLTAFDSSYGSKSIAETESAMRTIKKLIGKDYPISVFVAVTVAGERVRHGDGTTVRNKSSRLRKSIARATGERSPTMARFLRYLGSSCLQTDDFQEAKEHYQLSADLCRSAGAPAAPDLFAALTGLYECEAALENASELPELLDELVASARTARNPLMVGRALEMQGLHHYQQGQLGQAESAYRNSIAAFEDSTAQPHETARVLIRQAKCFEGRFAFLSAAYCYRRISRLFVDSTDEFRAVRIRALLNEARCHLRGNDLTRGEAVLQEAEESADSIREHDSRTWWYVKLLRCEYTLETGTVEEVNKLLWELIQQFDVNWLNSATDRDHESMLLILRGVSQKLADRFDLEQIPLLSDGLIEILRQTHRQADLGTLASAELVIGRIMMHRGQPLKATGVLSAAMLRLAEAPNPEEAVLLASIISELAVARAMAGNTQGALESHTFACTFQWPRRLRYVGRTHRQSVQTSLQARTALERLTDFVQSNDLDPALSYAALIRWKGATELIWRAAADIHDEAAERSRANLRAACGRFVSAALVPDRSDRQQHELRILSESVDVLEDQLLSRVDVNELFNIEHPVDELIASVKTGEVVVDFLEYSLDPLSRDPKAGRRLIAFCVSRDRGVVAHELGSAADIYGVIEKWTQNLDDRDLGLKVFERLWQPISDSVGDVQIVHIIPDGPLWLVPFAAIPRPESGFLVNDHAFTILPGAVMLLKSRASPGTTKSPQTYLASSVRNDQHLPLGSFPSIPASEQHLNRIHQLFAGFTTESSPLLHSSVSEPDFIKEVSEAGCCHLMAHGFKLTEAQTRFLDLARTGKPGSHPFGLAGVTGFRPAINSGVVLSGTGENDGVLSALEISALPLRQLQLLVLASCRTAAGKAYSDDSMSMSVQRAFYCAGARTIVAPPGEVSPAVSSLLAEEFYRCVFLRGFSTAEALRMAQLHVIENGKGDAALPRHWAWFHMGESQVLASSVPGVADPKPLVVQRVPETKPAIRPANDKIVQGLVYRLAAASTLTLCAVLYCSWRRKRRRAA